MIKVALDSNVLIYLAEVRRVEADEPKVAAAASLIAMLKDQADVVAPVQALGELFVVLRRTGVRADEARQIVGEFRKGFASAASDEEALIEALALASDHRLQFWDSMIIAASARAGCSLLLSEDMQDGFVVRGLTIANPFAPTLHPKLAHLLA